MWFAVALAALGVVLLVKSSSSSAPAGFSTTAFAHDVVASFYGPGFDGLPTANGETFNQNALTAAHRTLPFGTEVLVTNLANGASVVVRVNDRGPRVAGREIDLSTAAAVALNMIDTGLARVDLDLI